MRKFIKDINKKYEAFQKSISKPKHIVGLILAYTILFLVIFYKETLESIHPIIYGFLYVISLTWGIFHIQGLLGGSRKK